MSVSAPGTRWYNAVWRWHFYAGLFCLPFVLWLAVTGTIYLWKPQIERVLEARYDHLAPTPHRAAPGRIATTALAAVPGARLDQYQLPETPYQAVRVLVTAGGVQRRVYVDPYRSRVLGVAVEEQRPMRVVFRLHGTLLAGNAGSWLVEIAACWTITMLLTGLYLWWPRGRRGPAGVLYPRWRSGRRLFWRDTHAVAGFWASLAAIFLITSGLPWANAWGGYLKSVRAATGTTDGPIDWTTGAARIPLTDHAEHSGMAMAQPSAASSAAIDIRALDRVAAVARPLAIAPPVMILPPRNGGDWAIASDAADRTVRTRLTADGASGRITSRRDFAQRHWIDRAVGYGISIHEGAYLGLANQIAATIVTALLVTLSVSGAVIWWRRRKPGELGAPLPLSRPRYGMVLVAAIGALGIAMPLFGTTLVLVLLVERAASRYWHRQAARADPLIRKGPPDRAGGPVLSHRDAVVRNVKRAPRRIR